MSSVFDSPAGEADHRPPFASILYWEEANEYSEKFEETFARAMMSSRARG
jgi:hypothetical protein